MQPSCWLLGDVSVTRIQDDDDVMALPIISTNIQASYKDNKGVTLDTE